MLRLVACSQSGGQRYDIREKSRMWTKTFSNNKDKFDIVVQHRPFKRKKLESESNQSISNTSRPSTHIILSVLARKNKR